MFACSFRKPFLMVLLVTSYNICRCNIYTDLMVTVFRMFGNTCSGCVCFPLLVLRILYSVCNLSDIRFPGRELLCGLSLLSTCTRRIRNNKLILHFRVWSWEESSLFLNYAFSDFV